MTAAGPSLGLGLGPDSQGGPATHQFGALYSLMEAMSKKAHGAAGGGQRKGKQRMKVGGMRVGGCMHTSCVV